MKLPGEDDILRKLNQDSLDLYEYTDIVEVHINRIEGDFNKDYYQGFIVVSDGINNIKIYMKNIHGDFKIHLPSEIEIFTIDNCVSRGFESDNRYHLTDLEYSDTIDIWCEDLKLSLFEEWLFEWENFSFA